MTRTLGILAVLIVVVLYTAWQAEMFLSPININNLLPRIALYGILSIGAAFVIITGGIDLSIGSVVGLVGCLYPYLLMEHGFSVEAATGSVMGLSLLIGLIHGLLITRVHLQPFVATLCGLLTYRGMARWITLDATQGFRSGFHELKQLATGRIAIPLTEYSIPVPVFWMALLAVVAAVFLNMTVFGRHMMAVGRNEQAARYSGINTGLMTCLAYMICSLCAGIGGILFSLQLNSVQPASHGNFYELYAIAAAVLGGCSLRGGEGSILGTIIGTATIRVLYNAIELLKIPTQLEFAIIGQVILWGVIADELVRRLAARRRILQEARAAQTNQAAQAKSEFPTAPGGSE